MRSLLKRNRRRDDGCGVLPWRGVRAGHPRSPLDHRIGEKDAVPHMMQDSTPCVSIIRGGLSAATGVLTPTDAPSYTSRI